jgi:hypothetical protein
MRRQAVLVACNHAVAHSALTDPVASSVLSRLEIGGEIDHPSRLKLDRLVNSWDEEALNEVDSTHRGDLSPHAELFNKARAANALVHALNQESSGQESWLDATESIYEALVCLDYDPEADRFARLIDDILR